VHKCVVGSALPPRILPFKQNITILGRWVVLAMGLRVIQTQFGYRQKSNLTVPSGLASDLMKKSGTGNPFFLSVGGMVSVCAVAREKDVK